MLVSLVGNSKGSTVASSGLSTQKGFQVKADGQYWTNKLANFGSNINRNPSEDQVIDAAKEAGNAKVAKQLYSDLWSYKLETAQSMASMMQTEMNAMGRLASMSAQVAQTQNRTVEQFAAAGYQVAKSNAYTQGIANAYAHGLQGSSAFM